ncbi:neutral/alkaline non-lysosomal ceramidase N-terminal domain-containing protein [Pontibacter sp. Tf4]|uniref:neutral/alkaline non-lysosomal ceramidase N-terminal domain-containing protein n=1 Tax=Pontibacter sp. Tf4 TaxID=2761620 RepID=UPI00162791CC|nr:neutral/alkaline non-lysosomal ceramidase N-terminal domain-containing protein [Pontibacter sp. Tf4]MBB6610771.1 neutral/alkaline non-lysosomal ceramidase N-terminal domain-containing protein [Pontibacter sp. Tf4]
MKPVKKVSTRRKVFRYLLVPVLVLLFLACAIRKNDYTPYQQTAYYKQTIAALDQHRPTITEGDTLKVGWAKRSITPPAPFPLAGYGKRLGKEYTEVHDSAYVRTFAFDNGRQQAYFIALDMLITPMTLTAELNKAAQQIGLKPEQLYLSATHTHTSFGGWGEKLMGWVMAGSYSEEQLHKTTATIIESIKQARANAGKARVGYGEAFAGNLVENRLTGNESVLDTTIRFVKFEQADGDVALLTTFAAHATVLPSKQPVLSRDYPGALVDKLEEQVDFAAFAAGAVASHRPVYHHGDTFQSVDSLGTQLARTIATALPDVQMHYVTKLGYSRTPISLPQPEFRISDNYHLAPWLFYSLFGNYPSFVNSLQIGNLLLVGAPADYSGEYMKELEQLAGQQDQQLIVTGFNGGYMGYLTPSRHYMLDAYEVRDMNFYGKWGGDYLTDLFRNLIKLPHSFPALYAGCLRSA